MTCVESAENEHCAKELVPQRNRERASPRVFRVYSSVEKPETEVNQVGITALFLTAAQQLSQQHWQLSEASWLSHHASRNAVL